MKTITWHRAPSVRISSQPKAKKPEALEGRLPSAFAPSYLIELKGRRWHIAWIASDKPGAAIRSVSVASARSVGSYANLDAAQAVAQEHANQWEAFGVLWHDREHCGPTATDDFALEAFRYFQAGLQQGRRESQ